VFQNKPANTATSTDNIFSKTIGQPVQNWPASHIIFNQNQNLNTEMNQGQTGVGRFQYN
jgi:hypothetical protein